VVPGVPRRGLPAVASAAVAGAALSAGCLGAQRAFGAAQNDVAGGGDRGDGAGDSAGRDFPPARLHDGVAVDLPGVNTSAGGLSLQAACHQAEDNVAALGLDAYGAGDGARLN